MSVDHARGWTVAVASGKGGTGKTTVATGLAWSLARLNHPTTYADCDVEEPNGAIFLKPSITEEWQATVTVPHVDLARCTRCGRCSEFCQFKAIACAGDAVLTFHELCHACGGCSLVCPAGAISERPRVIGTVGRGRAGDVTFLEGRLNVGEPISARLVTQVRDSTPPRGITVIDAPPGTSCPVIRAVQGVDLALLVTEPTPFGLHDLGLAADLTRQLGLRTAVVLNRADFDRTGVERFCRDRNLEILAAFPDDRSVAEAYSRGEMPAEAVGEHGRIIEELARTVVALKTGGRS